MATITEQIYSNNYKDYILPYSNFDVTEKYKDFGVQILDTHYMLLHDLGSSPQFPIQSSIGLYNEYQYTPKVFTLLNTISLENSGIISSQIQPYLKLSGENTLIGFIDTGINYLHPAFINESGESRILSIWDQTIPPTDLTSPFQYGTVYNRYQINNAIKNINPYEIVPSQDTNGHGTALAGIACGSPDSINNFTGAAYKAYISMVKLKKAKPYLYDYYFADPENDIYQENDIMTAIRFLISQSEQYQLPLIICIGIGTNQGDHSGNSALSEMITSLSYSTNTTFAIACGNEGNKSHHAYHIVEKQYEEIELLVPDNTLGFITEIWGSTNALFSIGFTSPLGTQIAPISPRPGQNETITFVLEPSRIDISYSIVTESGGKQLTALRFSNPTPGNWIIRIYTRSKNTFFVHMWLPISGLMKENVTFYNPDPYTTLTIPSDANGAISTTSYNAYDNSFSIDSSRGYTADQNIKPNLASPGIKLTAPNIQNSYTSFSGSSASAAILAGSLAMLQQWRMGMPIPGILTSSILTGYLTRGAMRDEELSYPNRLWGYGKLNVFQIFESLTE